MKQASLIPSTSSPSHELPKVPGHWSTHMIIILESLTEDLLGLSRTPPCLIEGGSCGLGSLAPYPPFFPLQFKQIVQAQTMFFTKVLIGGPVMPGMKMKRAIQNCLGCGPLLITVSGGHNVHHQENPEKANASHHIKIKFRHCSQ